LNALPLVEPNARQTVGGLETFAWNLAKALASSGRQVSFVVRSPRRLTRTRVDGVDVLAAVEPLRAIRNEVSSSIDFGSGRPRLNRWNFGLLWKLPLLAAARLTGRRPALLQRLANLLRPAPPTVVIGFGVSADSRATIEAAAELGSHSIVWFQSNADLDPRLFTESSYRNEYGVTSADAQKCLELADVLIAQTGRQRDLLSQVSNRKAVVIPNPVDLAAFSPPASDARDGVLWIGRYDRTHKRPLLALEIARLCPDVQFRFAISPGQPDVAAEFEQRRPENVTVIAPLPHAQMPAAMCQAKLLLSTGSLEHEGFPNVLLEAAATGTPIVSLEDFDQFLDRSHAGVATRGDVNLAASSINAMLSDRDRWRSHSQAGREYVRQHHSITQLVGTLGPWLAPGPAVERA
jgi:glycosyltransferase involved in cell wall biosynthesis